MLPNGQQRSQLQSSPPNLHQYPNPFLTSDPKLDPNSPDFNVSDWARAVIDTVSQDPDKYPVHRLGVSYRGLDVHGFGNLTDYQRNVLNVLWHGPGILHRWLFRRQKKIQILRDFEGLVRPGEMLLVLGRPGR